MVEAPAWRPGAAPREVGMVEVSGDRRQVSLGARQAWLLAQGLLDGMQPVYCDVYRQADQPLRRAQGNNAFIAASPRYIMEALGMVLISALAYGLVLQRGEA